MRTIAEIVKEANGLRYMVNNLYQLMTHPADPLIAARPTGEWQANFKKDTGWFDYGRGATAEEALEDALRRAKGLMGESNRPISRVPTGMTREAEDVSPTSIEDLL